MERQSPYRRSRGAAPTTTNPTICKTHGRRTANRLRAHSPPHSKYYLEHILPACSHQAQKQGPAIKIERNNRWIRTRFTRRTFTLSLASLLPALGMAGTKFASIAIPRAQESGADRRNHPHERSHPPGSDLQSPAQESLRSPDRRKAIRKSGATKRRGKIRNGSARQARRNQPRTGRRILIIRRLHLRPPIGVNSRKANCPSLARRKLGSRRLFDSEFRLQRSGRQHKTNLRSRRLPQ